MWLLHMEDEENCKILHARNGREYKLLELPHFSVDGYCAVTRTVFKLIGCFFYVCNCQPVRDQKTLGADTLADRYERTMARIELISKIGCTVKLM